MNTKLNTDYIVEQYTKKNRSTSDIAKEVGTYPVTIARLLRKNGVKTRDHSQAQSINLVKRGHPFQGKKRTEQERINISDGIRKNWDALDESKRNKIIEKKRSVAKLFWDNKKEKDKDLIIKNIQSKRVSASWLGSKNENKIAELLFQNGYKILQRTNEYTPGNQFEVDIFLIKEGVAIEVDGPTHFKPLYGQEKLDKVIASDKEKNSILNDSGISVIRMLDKTSKHSRASCVRAYNNIVDLLKTIEKGRVYYIDLK